MVGMIPQGGYASPEQEHSRGRTQTHHGSTSPPRRGLAWLALLLVAIAAAVPAVAQQKTGPGVNSEDSLTWQGITLYGVVDIGLQYDTHSAPFTPYRPAASGNIVRQNSYQSVTGLTPSNMGQSRVGLQGIEPLSGAWAAVFQVEAFFNPQSGQLADSLKSLAANSGKPLTQQSVGVDGSSAGQIFQTAYAGFKSEHFQHLRRRRQQRGQPARLDGEVSAALQEFAARRRSVQV